MIEKLFPPVHKIIGISLTDLTGGVKKLILGRISSFNYRVAKADIVREGMHQNRKIWAIKKSFFPERWQLISTADLEHHKRTGLIRNDVYAKDMDKLADFYYVPGKGLIDKKIITNK